MTHRWEVLSLTDKEQNIKSNEERKSVKGILFRLCGYVFKHWYLFIPAVLLTLLANQLSLLGPKYSGQAIDAITLATGVNFDSVSGNVIKMLSSYNDVYESKNSLYNAKASI